MQVRFLQGLLYFLSYREIPLTSLHEQIKDVSKASGGIASNDAKSIFLQNPLLKMRENRNITRESRVFWFMASKELQKYFEDCKQLEREGVLNFELADAMRQASNVAFYSENDISYGLEIAKEAKILCNKLCKKEVNGTIWQLEKYCFDNHVNVDVLNCFYDILRAESPFWFESYIFYMEKNRAQDKRFYLPRRNPLKVVVNDLQRLEDTDLKFYGLSMPSRVGKALAYDTPVLTRNGWKKHGELTILDEVIGLDGRFKKILAIHNPCEMEYKVTFTDGEEIKCHGNHEWVLHTRNGDKIVTVDTNTIAKSYKSKDGHNIYTLPEKEIVRGSHKDLWVDAYTLGAWLGDGRNQNPDICEPESDYPIVQKILDAGYPLAWETKHKTTGVRYYGFKGLREQLQKYGMCHSRRRVPKRIPEEYLTADVETRLELLAGLLDTDGCLMKKDHRYQFSTTEETLKDGFISLISTFGWRVSVTKQEPKISSSGIIGRKKVYVIAFNPTMYIPCQLERKQLREYSKQRRVGIEKVEKIPHGTYGNCITVEDGVYCVGKTLKPTHNSTICIFFLSWIAYIRPNSHSAMGGHSGMLADGFYDELLNLITTPEYCFEELYTDLHPNHKILIDKSADKHIITLDRPSRFATFSARGIDGTWTGDIDISDGGYLYVDDLVRDREHSLSPSRMENTWQEYLNKMVDRKVGTEIRPHGGAKELMVGTLWNVLDPLERMRKQYEGQPQYLFRRIPALNEKDESNFAYPINGFSTQYYREMRERLDNAEWMAKYQQKPYIREGIVFPADELRYFNGILPEGEHRTVAVVDVAWGGGDHLSMPIGALYDNGDCYIFDWVFSDEPKEVTIPLVVGNIVKNEIRQICFEGNTGGEMYQAYVDEKLQEMNYKCSTESKKAPNKTSKMEKIIAYSGDIRRKFVFLQPNKRKNLLKKQNEDETKRYYRTSDYQQAMDEFVTFVKVGKNEHDDAVDSLAQLEIFIDNDNAETAGAKAIMNPFRGYWRA